MGVRVHLHYGEEGAEWTGLWACSPHLTQMAQSSLCSWIRFLGKAAGEVISHMAKILTIAVPQLGEELCHEVLTSGALGPRFPSLPCSVCVRHILESYWPPKTNTKIIVDKVLGIGMGS